MTIMGCFAKMLFTFWDIAVLNVGSLLDPYGWAKVIHIYNVPYTQKGLIYQAVVQIWMACVNYKCVYVSKNCERGIFC